MFKSGSVQNGTEEVVVDLTKSIDQGELHFGDTGLDQWVDMWLSLKNSTLIGNYIKYDGSTTSHGHFSMGSSGEIVLSGTREAGSAGKANWDQTSLDIKLEGIAAENDYRDWWCYERRH